MPQEAVLGTMAQGKWVQLQDLGAIGSSSYEGPHWVFSMLYRQPGQATLHQVNYRCPREVEERDRCEVVSENQPGEAP